MRWVQRFRMTMLMLFRRKAESERLNQELEFHLEQQIAENIANGMEPEQARSAALRLFGNPTLLRKCLPILHEAARQGEIEPSDHLDDLLVGIV